MASPQELRIAAITTPSFCSCTSNHLNDVVVPKVKQEMLELQADDAINCHTPADECKKATQETFLVVPNEEKVREHAAHEANVSWKQKPVEIVESPKQEQVQTVKSPTQAESVVTQRGEKLSARNSVKPTIIDLDAYEEKVAPTTVKTGNVEESWPPELPMALMVVPAAAEDMAVVRSVNDGNGETRSQPDLEGANAWRGFNTYVPAFAIERRSTGDGSLSPRAGVWDGPPRWHSSHIGILTVQCARCLKWRVVPTKEQYEAIRENILECPWVCENALQWRPDAHCNLPTDLDQDSGTLWAIDKPNLPSSPPGWQRKVIVRRDCSTRFADVYYTAPDGKTLRSMVEIGRYLQENPGSVPEGTSLRQFSFAIPQPLPGVWAARKRPTMRSVNLSGSEGMGKRAKAPRPLAKQLAQRLLHGSNSLMPPVVPSGPLPFVPASIQPLAAQAPTSPAAPIYSNTQAFPPLPPVRNSYTNSSFPGGSHGQGQVPSQTGGFSISRGNLISSVHQPELSSSSTEHMRRKRKQLQQQKSRLGVAASLSQNLKLPGILPLGDPSVIHGQGPVPSQTGGFFHTQGNSISDVHQSERSSKRAAYMRK